MTQSATGQVSHDSGGQLETADAAVDGVCDVLDAAQGCTLLIYPTDCTVPSFRGSDEADRFHPERTVSATCDGTMHWHPSVLRLVCAACRQTQHLRIGHMFVGERFFCVTCLHRWGRLRSSKSHRWNRIPRDVMALILCYVSDWVWFTRLAAVSRAWLNAANQDRGEDCDLMRVKRYLLERETALLASRLHGGTAKFRAVQDFVALLGMAPMLSAWIVCPDDACHHQRALIARDIVCSTKYQNDTFGAELVDNGRIVTRELAVTCAIRASIQRGGPTRVPALRSRLLFFYAPACCEIAVLPETLAVPIPSPIDGGAVLQQLVCTRDDDWRRITHTALRVLELDRSTGIVRWLREADETPTTA